jgi:hypothetical protein
MLKTRIKRRSAQGARALTRIDEIQASIAGLNDEDLLDLADIFSAHAPTFLGDAASAEMVRRNLRL